MSNQAPNMTVWKRWWKWIVGGGLATVLALLGVLFGDNYVGRFTAWSAREKPADGTPRNSEIRSPIAISPNRSRLKETQLRQRHPALDLIECSASCKGSPSDHTTVVLTLRNNTDHTLVVNTVKFNVGRFERIDAPVARPKNCKHDWTGYQNPFVDLDLDLLKVGDSVPVEAALEIPPRESRTFYPSFHFKAVDFNAFEELLVQGSLIFVVEHGELIQPIELCGPNTEVALDQAKFVVRGQ